jgi:dephospho-CoA kinase
MPRPVVIGVTGNIACGKSAVSSRLAERGATVLDADRLYHELIQPGMPLQDALKKRFGPQIIAPDGQIDRHKLGAIVFSNPAALADLDRLTHPAVVAETYRRIEAATTAVVVVDAIKLIESGISEKCDEVWLVLCRSDVQIERLMTRNSIDRADAERRIAAQPPLDAKIVQASRIFDNSGDLTSLHKLVDAAWSDLPVRPGLAIDVA